MVSLNLEGLTIIDVLIESHYVTRKCLFRCLKKISTVKIIQNENHQKPDFSIRSMFDSLSFSGYPIYQTNHFR